MGDRAGRITETQRSTDNRVFAGNLAFAPRRGAMSFGLVFAAVVLKVVLGTLVAVAIGAVKPWSSSSSAATSA